MCYSLCYNAPTMLPAGGRNAADHSDVRACRTVIQFTRVKCLLVMTAREMFHPSMGKSGGPGKHSRCSDSLGT